MLRYKTEASLQSQFQMEWYLQNTMVDKSHQIHSILFVHNTSIKAIEILTEKFNNFHFQSQF